MMSVDFSQIMNIILAAFAFGTLITAILTFRQTKEFEKQRIRPMMQAHLRMAEDPFSCAELVISNPEAYSVAGGMGFGWWLVEHYSSYHVDCPDGCGLGEPARGG